MKKRITAHIGISAVAVVSLIVGIIKGVNFSAEKEYSSGMFWLSLLFAALCTASCVIMDFYASIKDGSVEEWKDLLFLFERYERNDKNGYIYDMYCDSFLKKRAPVTMIGKINAGFRRYNPMGLCSYLKAWMPYIEIAGVALVAFAWSFGIQNIMMYWIASSPLYVMFWISIAILAAGLLLRWLFSEDTGTDVNIICAIINGAAVVALAIALAITGIVRHSNDKNYERYSADNIIVTVEEKTEATINSSYSNGYVTAFKIKIKSNSTLSVYNVAGEMIIYNAEGKVLDTGNCTFSCNLSKGDEGSFVLNIDRRSSDEVVELYYSNTEDLRITFRLTEVIYENYERKEYSVDAITILEPKVSESGETLTETKYQNALTLFNQGNYAEASAIFSELGRYKESYDYVRNCDYQIALDLYTKEQYKEALDELSNLGSYNNSDSKMQEICAVVLNKVDEYANAGNYSDAYDLCNQILQYATHELYYAYKSASEGDYVSAVKGGLFTLILPDGTVEISDGLFANCSELEKIVLPSSVVSIGNSAFLNCYNLTDINLPNGITKIGNSAFSLCKKLESITLPNTLNQLGDYAFQACESLKKIEIGATVESLGVAVFAGCKSLTSATLGSSIESIDDNAFYMCIALESIVIPSSVTSVGKEAFYGCVALKSVSFANNSQLSQLGYRTFMESGIESITLPGSLKTIAEEAFNKCSKLETLILLSGVETIGKKAFHYCSSLKNVTLSDTLLEIGSEAFYCCDIEAIILPESLIEIGSFAFYLNTNLATAVFENKLGWESTHFNTITMSYAVNVDNDSTNAKRLRDGYARDVWTCNKE